MSEPTPIILCGKSREVGDVVIEILKPEYKVIEFITSTEQGVAEIPQLLKDGHVYAIVTGGGYDDEAFNTMKEATEAAGCKPTSWLRPDKSKPGPKDMGPDYPKFIGERAKAALKTISGPGTTVF